MRLPKGPALRSIATVSLISAPLGVLLDNQHGLFNVLNYDSSGIPFQISWNDVLLVKSAAWVPILFAFAGLAMTSIQIAADQIFFSKQWTPDRSIRHSSIKQSSWPNTLYNISLFSFQYYLSGALDYLGIDPLTINFVLSTVGVLGFLYFDGSLPGLILALTTATAGPAAEIFIINKLHLYTYSHADILGICSWIPAIYFLGGSAVGNLGRSFMHLYCRTDSSISGMPRGRAGVRDGMRPSSSLIAAASSPLRVTDPPADASSDTDTNLNKFHNIMGTFYGVAGIAHLADLLAGESSLLKAAGAPAFSSLPMGGQVAAIV